MWRGMASSNSNVRGLAFIYFILIIWSISWAASTGGPVMPLYIRSIGIGVVEWGILSMYNAMGMVLFEWIWGFLSDRINRRILMSFSMFCTSIIFSLFTFKTLIPYFPILQFLFGAFAVSMGPTTRSIISDESKSKSIGFSMSLWSVSMILGRIIGPMVGSYIAQISSYEYSFYFSSLLSIFVALYTLIPLRGEGKRPHIEKGNSQSLIEGFRTLITIPQIRILFLLAFLTFIVNSSIRSFLPIYASERVGMSTMDVGILLASYYATMLFATPLFGRFSDRVGRKHIISTTLFLSSIMFLCYSLVKTPSQLLLVSIAVSMFTIQSPLLLAMLSEFTPRRLSGLSMGIYGSFEDLGLMVGPPIYGLIWSIYSPLSIFICSAGIQLFNALLIILIKEKEDVLGNMEI